MRDTKLILVEGLPGLGKSTAASWLASRLQSEPSPVNLFLEHQPDHPLNVGGDLLPAGFTPGEAFFQHYTLANFVQESLKRWEEFVHAALQADAISIFDSYPFQSTIRVLLQLNTTYDFINEYADHVETLVMPLQPMLIYFNSPDVTHALNHHKIISAQRGKAWTDYVEALITNCPYAIVRNLEGFSGVLAFISDYKQITDSLLRQSRLPRIILENCSESWEGCYQQIESFLKLS